MARSFPISLLHRLAAALALFCCATTLALAEPGRRVALVVGNGAYQNAPALPNPPNDARAVAEALRSLDFEVIEATNLDQPAMLDQVDEFSAKLEGAEAGLFYYAGHGLQVGGENYLVPIDARLQREAQVRLQTLPLQTVLDTMEVTVPTRIILLDACRDNPLAQQLKRNMGISRSQAIGQGLAEVRSAVGTLIAYATGPGDVAADGQGKHSPFTKALLDHIATPGIEVRQVLGRVREEVLRQTQDRQVPWESSSLRGEFFFSRLVPPKINTLSNQSKQDGETTNSSVPAFDERVDVSFWESIRESRKLSDYQAYMRRFPSGIFIEIARSRLEDLRSESQTVIVPPPSSLMIPLAPPNASQEVQVITPPTQNARPGERITPTASEVEVALALSERDWRSVQRALADLGLDPQGFDGKPGPNTRQALKLWQKAKQVEATGFLGPLQRELILAEARTKSRERGESDSLSAAATNSGNERIAQREMHGSSSTTRVSTERPTGSELQTSPQIVAPPVPVKSPAATSQPNKPASGRGSNPSAAPSESAKAPQTPDASKQVGLYEIRPPLNEMPEKRLALVIGNGRYKSALPLYNPINNADDIASALREIGFEVLKGIDLNHKGMSAIVKDFARRSRNADFAIVYYSGDGLQFEHANYLVPVDGRIQDEFDLADIVQLNQLIRFAGQAKKLSMVVVDACRDDPLATEALAQKRGDGSLSLLPGLAAPQLPPSQSIIAYATAAQRVCYDLGEEARNSPYTAALLKYIKTPKLEIRDLFGKVADDVRLATGNGQWPDTWNNLGGSPIYLVPGPPDPAGTAMQELSPSEVQLVQRSLAWMKYWSGPEDGVATPELTLAVRSWQRSQFVEDSGQLTPQQVIGLQRTAKRQRPRNALPTVDLGPVITKLGQGDVEAKRIMGMMTDPAYVDGPLPKDRATAGTWYQQAAVQGDREAAGLLGEMLVAPDNPLPNREDALKWLDIAAQAGDSKAAVRMAELMLERQGDAASRAKAMNYLKFAAADPATRGMANALLRHAGQSVTETAAANE